MIEPTQAVISPPRHGSTVVFRILGPVEVRNEDRRVELGGRKQRMVLALLVANAGRTISTDRLIDGVYGDDAPDGAHRSAQTYEPDLRAQVGDLITSVSSGYELRPGDSFVDAHRFAALVEAGRDRLGEDPTRAREDLASALALWRGHPYADVDARDEPDAR